MLLVRHASAGERLPTQALDRERPLDREGRADANRLSDTLANFPVERIVTSPHLRCIETVAQLGRAWVSRSSSATSLHLMPREPQHWRSWTIFLRPRSCVRTGR